MASSNVNNSVATDIDFDGAGVRLGLDAKRCYNIHNKVFLQGYIKSGVSFLAGEFNGTYDQGNQFDSSQVDTEWQAGRIVPVYELEVGAGWCSKCGTWSITGGYTYAAWTNVVKTDDGWVMVYISDRRINGQKVFGIGYALSQDGIHWERGSTQPLISTAEKNWHWLFTISVLEIDGNVHVYYSGRPDRAPATTNIYTLIQTGDLFEK